MLNTFDLAPDLDHENLPTRVLVRVDPAKVDQVLTVLAATANPEFPEEVLVDKPTDALEAQEAADDTFTALLLGLGGLYRCSLEEWVSPMSW